MMYSVSAWLIRPTELFKFSRVNIFYIFHDLFSVSTALESPTRSFHNCWTTLWGFEYLPVCGTVLDGSLQASLFQNNVIFSFALGHILVHVSIHSSADTVFFIPLFITSSFHCRTSQLRSPIINANHFVQTIPPPVYNPLKPALSTRRHVPVLRCPNPCCDHYCRFKC